MKGAKKESGIWREDSKGHSPFLKKGPVPLYYQLERVLRKRILEGRVGPSQSLPAERELCQEFGVSRTTVRQAMMILESEGLITREQGRGTFVKPRVRSGRPFELYGYVDDLFYLGANTTLELRSKRPVRAESKIAADMGIPEGEMVFHFEGVRYLNERDTALFEAYLPEEIGERISLGRLDSPFLILEVERVALETVRRANQIAYATVATGRHTAVMNVQLGHPLFVIKRIYFSGRDEALEMAITHFPGHAYQFFARLERVMA
jgi:GntR family transcriptional regulator